jgi:hypothetical protein
MDNVRTPIFVRLGARLKTFREGDQKKGVGSLKNVVIRNVKAKAAADAQIMPPSGVFITGIPDAAIEDLTLENIEIALAGGGTPEHARAVVEEKVDTYPEINRFGKTLPAYGVFLRHARGAKLNNFTLALDSPDHRPALVAEDVGRLEITGWKIPANAPGATLMQLADVQDATLSRISLVGSGAESLVRIEGKNSARIDATKALDDAGASIKTINFGAGANQSQMQAK